MKKFVRVLFLIVAISILALSFGCPTPTPTPTATTAQPTAASTTAPFQPIKLVFATTPLPGQPWDKPIQWMTKRIPEATGGRVQLAAYPYASLFTNTEVTTALMAGATDFTTMSYIMMAPVMPVINVTNNAMMFENQSHTQAFWKSDLAPEINLKLEKERGIKVLTILPASLTGGKTPIYNSVRQINKLEDLKGLKIRLPPSISLSEAFKKLGVSVISIPVADAPLALQQRMIDGLLTNWQHVPTYSLTTLTPYALDEEIDTGSATTFCACLKSWNRLPPDVQTAIQDVIAKEIYEALDMDKILSEPTMVGYAAYQSDPRTKTNTLSAEERARWLAIIKPAWQESVNSLSASEQALGQRILAKVEELRPQFARK